MMKIKFYLVISSLLFSLLVGPFAYALDCRSKFTFTNQTDDTVYLYRASEQNNVDVNFNGAAVPKGGTTSFEWTSNNGLTDSGNYWLHIDILGAGKKLIAKLTADAEDHKQSRKPKGSPEYCKATALRIVNGQCDKSYDCSGTSFSGQDFSFTLKKK